MRGPAAPPLSGAAVSGGAMHSLGESWTRLRNYVVPPAGKSKRRDHLRRGSQLGITARRAGRGRTIVTSPFAMKSRPAGTPNPSYAVQAQGVGGTNGIEVPHLVRRPCWLAACRFGSGCPLEYARPPMAAVRQRAVPPPALCHGYVTSLSLLRTQLCHRYVTTTIPPGRSSSLRWAR